MMVSVGPDPVLSFHPVVPSWSVLKFQFIYHKIFICILNVINLYILYLILVLTLYTYDIKKKGLKRKLQLKTSYTQYQHLCHYFI